MQFVENRKPHEGLPSSELQRWDGKPDGIKTNKIAANVDKAERMRAFIAEWEASHPVAEPVLIEGELDDATRAQMEAVGYLGGDDE